MGRRPPTDITIQKDLIGQAQVKANAGDGTGTFECLFNSMLFEALLRRFGKRYPRIVEGEIYDTIAASADELCSKITQGRKVERVETYLWKTVNNKLSRRAIIIDSTDSIEQDSIELVDRNIIPELQKIKYDNAKMRAIEIAEGLLPKLGQVNIQAVMRYILEAIKNGARDIPASEIAEALNMTPGNVRVSVSRGFQRLVREVKKANLIEEDYEFSFIEEYDIYEIEQGDQDSES